MVVRYLFRGSIFAFRSYVMAVLTLPDPLLFLGYPSRVEEHNIRSAPRLELLMPTLVEWASEDTSIATLVDVSRTGCQVLLATSQLGNENPRQGESVRVHCRAPGMDADTIVSGSIQRLTQDSERVALGIVFEQPEEKLYHRILDHLAPATGQGNTS